MEKKFDAVLFDMDGTLTDTEKYYQEAWPKSLAHFGYEMSAEKPLILRSLGRPYAVEQFKEWYGPDFDYWAVRNYRKQMVEEIFKDGIPLKPGAKEILQWLRDNGVFVALVTANDKDRAERYTKRIGLFEYFDAIVCADMVEFGKPAPDIYAYACKELKVAPENTLAVEDSPNGCTSAYRAGCNVVMVPDLTEPDEELKKMLYARVDKLLDIKKLF
ncbi:haloacid dehalogenase superfamily, subfamily IA, variant 3 with third motif having DD or ED/haloacid dehalogenase superfamily, subfamily IA, variant 1 with third motif having Dx(3-4)D or Dx(3-4)E [Pseudobutyrivibrio sp. YE44]|uniref:HAD family hydrolase n=1 Tax=Pseudobutyrivibrio sp. YE44 TaxID=1520802 RepID=UPI00087DFFFD|nr:HAD family phosphatase [Pseudobutyrivibrio sp. YE44]SDB19858.1 haloacid dehalogenase superfamily, subfamily IA, variant 3 with third motif having DD or ED/haloacid dehalogenase superfamily, subfamily IA, variant 1 with third motif having Dx(3-4)D or Dx(3-4)E [Pseudobutyrivibrio sp. YE44]